MFDIPSKARTNSVATVASELLGLQAQDFGAAALQVRSRSRGLTRVDFEDALFIDRSVVRTSCMRGTLHVLLAEDVRWVLRLIGPVAIRKTTSRSRSLGIDYEITKKARKVVAAALEGGKALVRASIFEALKEAGIATEGQAGIHILRLLALEGMICYGRGTGRDETFVLLEEWLHACRDDHRGGDVSELARRYVAAYGPVTPDDFSWWSGLGASESRKAWGAIADELIEVEVVGRTSWLSKHSCASVEKLPASRAARLLPAFDPYILGYRDRALSLEQACSAQVNSGGGIIRPTVVIDGRIVGTWSASSAHGTVEIVARTFKKLSKAQAAGLESEASDVARYLNADAFDLDIQQAHPTAQK